MRWSWLANAFSKLLRPGAGALLLAGTLSAALKAAGPRRAVAVKNLSIALPEAPPEKIKRLVNETYSHMVWVAEEFLILQRDPAQVLEWVAADGADILSRYAKGGAILITGHVGNWEITAAWIAQSGYRVTAIVREPDDSEDRGLIGSMRRRAGVMCLPKSATMKSAISILKKGEFLGILPDQHGGDEGIMAPFFGIETPTSRGPAFFAYTSGCPLIPIFSRRVAPFRHEIRIAPPIAWEKRATRDETLFGITKLVNESIERMILEAPGQWLAQHRRFREIY
ncbi:MAG: lysophospholipid acyltransferase family protein [Synergistaceae bacterium]|jgi:KDO2-lipid IV(A) lauroyltransferase|nr:lysophospholipid acyltransferase family protein [Synergistaceae bacterium]